jgi:hypothetical protein
MQYRIYYEDNNITLITKRDLPGEFVVVNKELWLEVSNNPNAYIIEEGKVLKQNKKQGKIYKKKFKIQETNFPAWIIDKDNLFLPVSYEETKPDWFDENKHSVANYD